MSDNEVPKPDWKDNTLAVIKIGASAIPVAGGPIVEGLNFIDIRYLLGKRLRAFCEDINERLVRLEQKGEGQSPEKLAANEAFITTLLHAIQATTRSHEKEKLRALRNAVLNSALSTAPGEDMQLIFINLLDSMTASHIRMLMLLNNPESFLKDIIWDDDAFHVKKYIREAFPEMDQNFSMIIVQQLIERGLIEVEFDTRYYKSNNFTTDLGNELLQFIKSPLKDDHEESAD